MKDSGIYYKLQITNCRLSAFIFIELLSFVEWAKAAFHSLNCLLL
jgi:hypothetical protein